MPSQHPAYALAISAGAAALTLLLRWFLDPWLGEREALSLLYAAVGAAVWVGGWRPATGVLVAGYLASDWLFIEPRRALGLDTTPDLLAAGLYLMACVIIIAFGEAMRRARAELLVSKQAVELQREELKELNGDLRQADQRKDDFVATLAHELRSPLAPIRNAVQIWKATGASDAQRARAADVVDRQVSRMSRLLEELLDVSRIKQGKIDIRTEYVPLSGVVESALEISKPNIDASGHELRIFMPEQPVFLRADPARLAQVISNLLNNSAKYTDAGGRIELHAASHAGTVELRVEDNGMGFPPEVGDQLFVPFAQTESATGRAAGGLGIGLSLVKAIVEMHGGSVHARSDGPQRGSQFVVRLPAGAAS